MTTKSKRKPVAEAAIAQELLDAAKVVLERREKNLEARALQENANAQAAKLLAAENAALRNEVATLKQANTEVRSQLATMSATYEALRRTPRTAPSDAMQARLELYERTLKTFHEASHHALSLDPMKYKLGDLTFFIRR